MIEFIRETAEAAGKIALEYFEGNRPNEIHSKATERDMVSTADKKVEQEIIRRITERFPDHGIYGEESGKSHCNAEYVWVIDPIDGTQSFIKHHPYFSISIALQKNGKSVAGGVFAPKLGEFFFAELGKGASLNGKPIHVSSCTQLEDAACTTGFACLRAKMEHNGLPLFCELAPRIRDIKRCGSAALDLCHVACGVYDAYWEFGLALYDMAAGALIARESGAVVCDYCGSDQIPEKGILAANPVLSQKFLEFTKNF